MPYQNDYTKSDYGIFTNCEKKNTVSPVLKICPLTVYDLLLCPMLLVIIIHLVIFLAVCCEIWQIHVNLWFDWMTNASWEDLSAFNKLQPYQSIQ